jgi:Ca2+-binding RTX toxin-like protein
MAPHRPQRSRASRGTAVAAALLAAALAVAEMEPIPPAHAAVTCSLEGGVLSLTADGDLVLARDELGLILVNGAPLEEPCAGTTVEDLASAQVTTRGRASLDLANGGFVKADGTPVPITLELGGTADAAAILGTDADEEVAAGTGGLDLTADGEPDVLGLGGAERLVIRGDAGADALSLRGGGDLGGPWDRPSLLDGGDGVDALTGGDGPDLLRGGPGDDEMEGRSGDDRFVADALPDGADALEGGSGTDTADYGDRTASVSLFAQLEPSGADGEGDTLIGIETLVGGSGDDVLVGAGMNDTLVGGPGADVLRGGSGRDVLRGGGGADRLVGGLDPDELVGSAGSDRLRGGGGNDRLQAGAGRDLLDGGDGRDRGNGGPGVDSCWSIEVATSCERAAERAAGRPRTVVRSAADPFLAWNTFLGGPGDDLAAAIARSPTGGAVVVGTSTRGWGTPIVPFAGGGADAFVARLDARGSILWSTFLGGAGQDVGTDVAVGTDGAIFVSGWSAASWGEPVRAFRGRTDGFVARLDPEGRTAWVTFLGGSGGDRASALALDPLERPVVAGVSSEAWGDPLAPQAGGRDAVLASLRRDGALRWMTFLGGPGDETASSLAASADGRIALAGTATATFGTPVAAFAGGPSDAFVASFEADGTPAWLTFLGGSGSDAASGVTFGSDGHLFVAGRSSSSWGSPARRFADRTDGFLAEIGDPGTLLQHTFLGGSGWDTLAGLAATPEGDPVTVGRSTAAWGKPWRPYVAGSDGVAVERTQTGLWSAFVGGAGEDEGRDLALGEDRLFVVGTSDASWGTPIRAFRGGWTDAFVAALRARAMDIRIGSTAAGPFIGDRILDPGGDGEALRVRLAPGDATSVFLPVRNAGLGSDSATASGCSSSPYVSVRYFHGSSEVTDQAVEGTLSLGPLRPGDEALLRIRVRLRRSAESDLRFVCRVQVAPAAAPRMRDATRAVIVAA